MNKKAVCVVIPLYKVIPNAYEQIALQRYGAVLSEYPLLFVAPERLDVSYYCNQYPAATVLRFNQIYFENVDGYSKLLLSTHFYDRFKAYEYMLIYQLDAFVFSDQLADWCDKGFDYVGAPWIGQGFVEEGQHHSNMRRRFVSYRLAPLFPKLAERQKNCVGNGGLSLRKVSSFRRCARIWKPFAQKFKGNEDLFWSYFATSTVPAFTVPGTAQALEFAFDTEPRQAYELNGERLPFGCHAWEKYDIAFWRPIFQTYGYTI